MAGCLLAWVVLVVAHAGSSTGDASDYLSRYAAVYGAPAVSPAGAAAKAGISWKGQADSTAAVDGAVGAKASPSAAAASLPEFEQSADKATTVEELERWRQQHVDQINKFVPQPMQKLAFRGIEKDYAKRSAELRPRSTPEYSAEGRAEVASSDSQGKTGKSDTTWKGKSFPAMLDDAQGCQSPEELRQWLDAIRAHIQTYMRPEYRSFAFADAQKRFNKRSDELEKTVVPPPPGARAFQALLKAAEQCNTQQELQAWRAAITDVVTQRLPAELHPLAMADVQKRYELRLASMKAAATITAGSSLAGNMGMVAQPPLAAPEGTPAQALAKMFQEVDTCKDETELRAWRQKVASHVRIAIPARFQIPALGDMQMRFERRLDVLRKAASNARAMADGKDINAAAHAGDSGTERRLASWTLVLAGLALPALISFVGGIVRSSRKEFHGGRTSDRDLLET